MSNNRNQLTTGSDRLRPPGHPSSLAGHDSEASGTTHRMRISNSENGGLLLSPANPGNLDFLPPYGGIEDSRISTNKYAPRSSFSV
jgi:hypothetical protein